MYISTHQALLDFCQRAREFDAVAVDTEFLRARTFHPRLCLVQIATPAESVAVDPLVIDDLSPLAELMADESVTKVFHACSQDMEVMLHTVGVLPRPIFDTQVAAAFLGERQQISYGALVQTFCGVSLPKTESLTDWSRRPLTDKQIEYAIDDVKYLIVAYTEMMSRLRELGRVGWVLDELRPLADESHYRADRHEAFRKVKRINSCSRHQLGIARELAAWREDRAERRNIPRKWVMSDDTLLALVKRKQKLMGLCAESVKEKDMKKRKNKKGFTIVELVIVIAVIAILAAVLIPTFSSLIKKANESADIQAVRQMNTSLAIHETTENLDNIADVIAALDKENLDLDNYKPLVKGCHFFWVKNLNRIIYVDAENKVIFPEEYKSLEKEQGNWYSLSGEIQLDSSWKEKIESGNVEISSGEQLASFIDEYQKGNTEAQKVQVLTVSEDIDLSGATYRFGDITKDLTIQGKEGQTPTIYGFRNDTNSIFGSGEFAKKGYGYGLFGNIKAGAEVVIKDVNLDGMVVKDTINEDTGTMGLISGYVNGTLILENVNITNSVVEGNQKIGGIAGTVGVGGNLKMSNVMFENTFVYGCLEVAKLVGYVNDKATVTAENLQTEKLFVKPRVTITPYEYCGESEENIINPTDIIIDGKEESGVLYLKASTFVSNFENEQGSYVWTVLTNEYYWKLVKRNFRIGDIVYGLPSTSTSENITAS